MCRCSLSPRSVETISPVKEEQRAKKTQTDEDSSAKAKNPINSSVYKQAEMYACQDG